MALVILAYPDPAALSAAAFIMGFGIFYGYTAALGSWVQVRDGALIVANLFREHRIPLRRFVDLTSVDYLEVNATIVDEEAIEIHAMTQLQSTSVGNVRRKLKRLLTMLDEHAAPPADGPVTMRLRWESVTVMAVGLTAFTGGIILTFILDKT
ncbi:hypothetical protein [Asanoa ishikariensis]|uniref:hypothetical protein n=1 Tax=Asanoa ishikariensis TaxID=137265 RepID=UPI00115FD26F|nr:hypothetical protein [Asanoa ishikariensis]